MRHDIYIFLHLQVLPGGHATEAVMIDRYMTSYPHNSAARSHFLSPLTHLSATTIALLNMPPSHRPTQLNFITGNANKLAEVRAILADTGVELSSKALDLPELQGGIEEISRDKCRRAAEAVSVACMYDVRLLLLCRVERKREGHWRY